MILLTSDLSEDITDLQGALKHEHSLFNTLWITVKQALFCIFPSSYQSPFNIFPPHFPPLSPIH